MMPVSELRLDPLVPVPDHVAVQHVYEPVHRDAREAALVEELLLETAEEPLRGGVVRTASLRAHRTRQVVVLADADPLGPPVVAAAVGMDDWFLPVPERGARVGGHAVGQCRVRAGADRPRDRKPVVAVDHGRQIGLARGNRELREVRDPQHVRTLGVEVAVHQVLRRLGGLALVRAVPLRALEQGRQAMPGRQPHDPFGRYPDAHEGVMHLVHELVGSRMTRLADTLTPMPFSSRWIRLYPYLRLLFSNASSTKGSSHASLSGLSMALIW